jgi:hypothetical protein
MSDRPRQNGSLDIEERFNPLVERLRHLEWPKPPPGVRERTLREVKRVLVDTGSRGDRSPHGDQ